MSDESTSAPDKTRSQPNGFATMINQQSNTAQIRNVISG